MRALMGLIKDRHGTYYAQRKVPERLQAEVARVLDNGKPKQVYLKKSLGTKNLKAANVAATHVIAGFDRTLAQAEDRLKARPVTASITSAQIKRIAEAYYASILENDEEERREGTGSEAVFQSVAKQFTAAGVEFNTPFAVGAVPEAGLSDREMYKRRELLADQLPAATAASAKGDTTYVRLEVDDLLDVFQVNLDRKSLSYRQLGMAVLAAHVKALKAIQSRDAGDPIETPVVAMGPIGEPSDGATLRNAMEGWQKERQRPKYTVQEYTRAVEMHIQLHGDLPLIAIKRSHARLFRDAIRDVPSNRTGALREASLPELVEYGRKHPSIPKVSVGTVNKQLGALQAIAGWAYEYGMIPEDVPWTNPFANMRLQEEQSDRAPFEPSELQKIFNAPLFTRQENPVGAKGAAGVWLPLLALFTGARQAEIGSLQVANVQDEAATGTPLLFIVADRKAGKKLKTKSSERVVPIHPELVKLGFLDYVAARRREGEKAWLFPTVAPDHLGALRAWSKFFGRYLRTTVGIADPAKVFHSFRHGFKDAARAAGVSQEVHDALTGHSNASTVSGGYGAKQMLQRFGVAVLKKAMDKISYPGLDLSRVRPSATPKRAPRSK
jgi:integrase